MHIHFQSQAISRLGFHPILIYFLEVRISQPLSTTSLSSIHLYTTIPTFITFSSDRLLQNSVPTVPTILSVQHRLNLEKLPFTFLNCNAISTLQD